MITILILILALTPASLFCAAVTWSRRHDRQIVWPLVVATLWGAIVATSLALVVGRLVEMRFIATTSIGGTALDTVIVAPMVEEGVKACVLIFLLMATRLETSLEGFSLGAAVGLGFAATENFFAFVAAYRDLGLAEWITSIALRTLLTTVMHATATAAAGVVMSVFAAGLHFDRWILGPALGYFCATAIHGAFNGGLESAEVLGELSILFVAVFIGFLILWLLAWSRRHEDATYREQLFDDAFIYGRMTLDEANHLVVSRDNKAKRLALLRLRAERKPGRVARQREIDALREALRHEP